MAFEKEATKARQENSEKVRKAFSKKKKDIEFSLSDDDAFCKCEDWAHFKCRHDDDDLLFLLYSLQRIILSLTFCITLYI